MQALIFRLFLIRPLALFALVLAVCYSPRADADVLAVTQCGDDGPGSLRQAVAMAADGDVLDFSSIPCFRIKLTSGPIVVTQNNLEVSGSKSVGAPAGLSGLTVDAERNSRIFLHLGTGTLRLINLNLDNGMHVAEFATGGCVHSEGTVELISLAVDGCEALGQGGSMPIALGGAVHARTVVLKHTGVHNSKASGANGYGGGISSEGRTTLLFSIVGWNSARSGGGLFTLGGATLTYTWLYHNRAMDNAGMQATGGIVTINKSTIISNEAQRRCGGVCVTGTDRSRILDSTLSNNRARFLGAGELSDHATISNSTIANNTDTSRSQCVGVIRARHLKLLSTIVAANLCEAGLPAYDVGGRAWEGYTLEGFHNFIGRSRLRVPEDTLSGDPRLQPLGIFHSSLGSVHMPFRDSPVINRGANPLNRQYDQRGPGFPRVRGESPDIGSVEF